MHTTKTFAKRLTIPNKQTHLLFKIRFQLRELSVQTSCSSVYKYQRRQIPCRIKTPGIDYKILGYSWGLHTCNAVGITKIIYIYIHVNIAFAKYPLRHTRTRQSTMTQTSQDTHLRPHLGQLRKNYLESIAEISCVPIECLYNHVHHEDQTDDSSDGVGNDMHTTTTQETPTALEEPDSEFKDFTKNEALQHSESLVFDGLQALYLDNNHSTYESDYSEAGQIQAQTMSQLFGTALFQNKQATNMKNVLLLLEDMISQQDQDKVNEQTPSSPIAHIFSYCGAQNSRMRRRGRRL